MKPQSSVSVKDAKNKVCVGHITRIGKPKLNKPYLVISIGGLNYGYIENKRSLRALKRLCQEALGELFWEDED